MRCYSEGAASSVWLHGALAVAIDACSGAAASTASSETGLERCSQPAADVDSYVATPLQTGLNAAGLLRAAARSPSLAGLGLEGHVIRAKAQP